MLVRELIELLQRLPQNVPVIYDLHSDVAELEADQITNVEKEDRQVLYRDGRYQSAWAYNEENLKLMEPHFVACVRFPGN